MTMDYPKINQIETPITTVILIRICSWRKISKSPITWYAAIDLADFFCLFSMYLTVNTIRSNLLSNDKECNIPSQYYLESISPFQPCVMSTQQGLCLSPQQDIILLYIIGYVTLIGCSEWEVSITQHIEKTIRGQRVGYKNPQNARAGYLSENFRVPHPTFSSLLIFHYLIYTTFSHNNNNKTLRRI